MKGGEAYNKKTNQLSLPAARLRQLVISPSHCGSDGSGVKLARGVCADNGTLMADSSAVDLSTKLVSLPSAHIASRVCTEAKQIYIVTTSRFLDETRIPCSMSVHDLLLARRRRALRRDPQEFASSSVLALIPMPLKKLVASGAALPELGSVDSALESPRATWPPSSSARPRSPCLDPCPFSRPVRAS